MKKYNLTWQQADMQLLEALLLATGGEGGAILQDVLLMADAIDGTIFTLQELEQGLEKLVAVGYVGVQKNKLFLTTAFLQQYEEITLSEGLQEEHKPLMKLLQQKALSDDEIEEKADVLKKYKLKNHYQQYLEQFG